MVNFRYTTRGVTGVPRVCPKSGLADGSILDLPPAFQQPDRSPLTAQYLSAACSARRSSTVNRSPPKPLRPVSTAQMRPWRTSHRKEVAVEMSHRSAPPFGCTFLPGRSGQVTMRSCSARSTARPCPPIPFQRSGVAILPRLSCQRCRSMHCAVRMLRV